MEKSPVNGSLCSESDMLPLHRDAMKWTQNQECECLGSSHGPASNDLYDL